MRNLIALLFIIMLSVNLLFAQEKVEAIDSIYVQSDTSYAEVEYDFYYDGSKFYEGVVGYQYTVVDTIFGKIALEGSADGVTYVSVVDLDSTYNGNYVSHDIDPEFVYYRLAVYGLAGDTATLKDIVYFEKIPRK